MQLDLGARHCTALGLVLAVEVVDPGQDGQQQQHRAHGAHQLAAGVQQGQQRNAKSHGTAQHVIWAQPVANGPAGVFDVVCQVVAGHTIPAPGGRQEPRCFFVGICGSVALLPRSGATAIAAEL